MYEATQLYLNRKVALKLIAPEMGADRTVKERFRREGLHQAAIEHPHIVTVHEAGETEHGLYFAMRLVRGPTLKAMIVARQLDAGRTVRILSQVADALDTAHDQGLIHRDVKPQNILVGDRDHAYLADFGLTKAPGDQSITKSGGFMGTLDYVAPEQIRGEPTTPRTDVYALAGVLYECLTGAVPYPMDSDPAILWAHMALAPPRVSEQRPDLPAALDEVITRAMAKQPGSRFAAAGELLRRAEEALPRPSTAWLSDAASAMHDPAVAAPPQAGHPLSMARPASKVEDARVEEGAATTVEGALADGPAVADREAHSESRSTIAAPVAPGTSFLPRWPRSRPRPTLAITAAVFAGALAIGGYHAGGLGVDANPAAEAVVAGPLRLTAPDGWGGTASVPEVPGLQLSQAAGASPDGRSGGPALLAGLADGTGPTLLPARLLARLPRAPSTDDVVALGELEAYRYRGLRPRGLDRPLTLYVLPTEKRVATVACLGSQDAAHAAACEQAAGTLELDGVRGLQPGPRRAYAKPLNAVTERLARRRDLGRERLRRAPTPSEQARAARALARDFRLAASSLKKVPAGPAERRSHEALRDSVKGAQRAYSRLASAVRRESRADFSGAAASVRRHESRIERDLAALGRLGYSVR